MQQENETHLYFNPLIHFVFPEIKENIHDKFTDTDN
jgi:hypothetical protein